MGVDNSEEESKGGRTQAQDYKRGEEFLAESAGEGPDVGSGVVEVGLHGGEGSAEPLRGARVGVGKLEDGGGQLLGGRSESGGVDGNFLG